ncbi:uncharacterized protein LOC105385854 isoform X2 [Plutella xylostella]|uniref:uncharacterized protein LOC105385854 isoform X2 n=1 Tax=Plutella xylostella TaxID=51655 RepID=UPI002032A05F|nr:uncharacterized protein LOC105385854 isoform X2 [Plutella xylostella]
MAAFKMMSVAGVVVLALALGGARGTRGGTGCGGHLQGPHGVIQTPNFPDAFPVPIRCKWVISHATPNGTISIYFTQQYTTSGLTFTEYIYYDDSYKLGERPAFTVTEENITRVKWLQVQSPYLVVELSLDALEGTQLRALGLLSVFGLNITYAVTPPPAPVPPAPSPPASSCSALECRLLGHCYATWDYRQFYCSCFEGYSGADCGAGPLCAPNMCMNGGVCRQMGLAAVSCICAPGFSGDLCETQIPPECGIDECLDGCRDEMSCDCNPRDSDTTSARFETKIQVMDHVNNTNISQEILTHLTAYFKASNITLDDEIEILNLSSPDASGARSVAVRVWGARRSAAALRAALARLPAARRSRLRVLPAPAHVDMQPALSLHALTVNQRSEVWEGSEFILSCTAYGSPDTRFTWYKDGVKINFNGTLRDIWTRTVAEDALGRRISVLGVSEARALDGGRWACGADDAGRRRCRALWLAVLRPPDVRLLPSTLTVNKGDNVSITCLAGASRVHGALGFSWARERTLLPLVPGREVWEDLYPAGSVLKLYNVQKSGEYRCQVSSIAGTTAKSVALWTVGTHDEHCEHGASNGIRWPKTAPGAYASVSCPTGYVGETTRFCEPKSVHYGVKWRLPDFSGCIAESLKNIYEQFVKIKYGYSWEEVSSVAQKYSAVLRSLPALPGDGAIPLQHTADMLHYLHSTASKPREGKRSAEHLLKIYNTLLKHPDAFLDEQKTYQLQNNLVETIAMKAHMHEEFQEFLVMSKPVQDDNAAHFKLPLKSSGNEEWIIASAGVELVERAGNASIIAVLYNNLASRLPSLRSSIEYKNGREIEYLLSSQQIQLSATGTEVDTSILHTVSLLFTHIYNYSAVASKLACALRSQSEPGAWYTKACEVQIPEPKYITCRCHGLGTYALFTVARSTLTEAEKDLRGVVKITAGIGGAMGLAVAGLQLLGLVANKNVKLPILLKATTAGTHSAAMLTLLECDTRQAACPGVWGWVCAACWCAGCAALCAQPLLLQAELAGRPQNAPTVGLLAGVCILVWLTARLWGGPPLQLGAPAQLVCACGSILLLILCFVLAICAALRLRTITYKVPVERRSYLNDRQRVIRHTVMLLVTTTMAQMAGIAYAQPGERQTAHVISLAVAAITNGIALVVCYVVCDDACLVAARRALSLAPHRDWEDAPAAGDTSLNLYIKQGGEVESRGGAVDSSSSQISPVASYWQPHPLDSTEGMYRRMSTPSRRDCDIVRCVEYAECSARRVSTTRALCDLVPRVPACALDVRPCTPHNHCALCTRSNPDVSTPDQQPIKSCLKKSSLHQEFSSSTSLPSMDVEKKSNIELVNKQWNKAYDSPDTEKVLSEISSDLNFLLNKPVISSNVLDQIEEAPT